VEALRIKRDGMGRVSIAIEFAREGVPSQPNWNNLEKNKQAQINRE